MKNPVIPHNSNSSGSFQASPNSYGLVAAPPLKQKRDSFAKATVNPAQIYNQIRPSSRSRKDSQQNVSQTINHAPTYEKPSLEQKIFSRVSINKRNSMPSEPPFEQGHVPRNQTQTISEKRHSETLSQKRGQDPPVQKYRLKKTHFVPNDTSRSRDRSD